MTDTDCDNVDEMTDFILNTTYRLSRDIEETLRKARKEYIEEVIAKFPYPDDKYIDVGFIERRAVSFVLGCLKYGSMDAEGFDEFENKLTELLEDGVVDDDEPEQPKPHTKLRVVK